MTLHTVIHPAVPQNLHKSLVIYHY